MTDRQAVRMWLVDCQQTLKKPDRQSFHIHILIGNVAVWKSVASSQFHEADTQLVDAPKSINVPPNPDHWEG